MLFVGVQQGGRGGAFINVSLAFLHAHAHIYGYVPAFGVPGDPPRQVPEFWGIAELLGLVELVGLTGSSKR